MLGGKNGQNKNDKICRWDIMNENIKQEIREYCAKVEERKKLVDKELSIDGISDDKLKLNDKIDEKISALVISYLKKKGYKFGVERLANHSFIKLSDDGKRIMYRWYRCHHFNTLNFMNGYGSDIINHLLNGLKEVCDKIQDEVNKINELDNGFKYKKEELELKVEYLEDGKIVEDVIEQIEIDDNISVDGQHSNYYENDVKNQLCLVDEFYAYVQEAIQKKKEYYAKIKEERDVIMKEIDSMLSINFEKLIITIRLGQ